MPQPDWFTVGFVFVGSSTVAAFVAHRLTRSRDADGRRTAFRGHLGRWLGAIHQTSDTQLRRVHDEFAPHVMGYYATLAADSFRKRKLRRLCEAVSTTNKEALGYRGEITQKIETLLDFL